MLNRLRKISQHPFVVILVALNFLFVSCNMQEIVETKEFKTNHYKAKINYNQEGKKIVKGLFFFQGKIGSNVEILNTIKNQIQDLPDSIKTEYQAFVDETIYKMDSLSPNFFDKLYSTVKSGTFQQIKEELGTASMLMQTAIMMNPKYLSAYENIENKVKSLNMNDYDFEKTEDLSRFVKDLGINVRGQDDMYVLPVPCVTFALAAVYVSVALYAVAATTVAAANAVVAVNIAYLVNRTRTWDPFSASNESMLLEEQVIAELVSFYQ